MTVERRPTWRRWLRHGTRVGVIMLLGLPLLAVTTAASAVGLLLFGNLPGTVPEENPRLESQPSYVYDAQGNEIGVFREYDLTVPMTRDAVPQVLKDAVVAAEDQRFWSHEGIDPEGLARAAMTNYEEGRTVQGGSTITQQYVKARYLSSERSIERKFNEALLATRVERQLREELGSARAAKEEILFRYLDETYFGGGAYGAGAAAQTYFRKDVKDLTLSEAATLAGVIPSPSKYGPRDNVVLAETRRQQVLGEMLSLGMVSQTDYDAAMAQHLWYLGFGIEPEAGASVTLVYTPPDTGAEKYPYFVDYVRQYLIERYGSEKVFRGGLRIETTIDPHLQDLAEAAVNKSLYGTSSPLEMSLVSVEPTTGFVKAFVGGRDFRASQVNLGLGGSLGMQAGSSFKTFTLATALEQGFGTDTTYRGGPWTMPGCVAARPSDCVLSGTGGDMKAGTAASSNAWFGQLANDVGPNRIAEMANRLGVSRISPDKNYSLTITLGLYEVSPLDMASGYATIANHGVRPKVTPVVKVTEPDGTVLEENGAAAGTRVLDAAIADTVTDVLRGVIDGGTGKSANIGRPAAGKTGTAPGNKAAWFVGYTPQLTTAVWMGYSDEPRPLVVGGSTVFGGGIPARTWAAFMRPAHESLPVLDFPVPGPLPAPRSDGEAASVRKPKSRELQRLARDCSGPCVQTPTLEQPTTTTTTTTAPATTPTTGTPAQETD